MSDVKLNKQALKLYNVTNEDYLQWCKTWKKAAYKPSTKEDFFTRLREGRLIKDVNGKLVRKNRKK